MKFTFIQSDEKEEIIAYAKNKNELINKIEEMCNVDGSTLIGYSDGVIEKINPLHVECFFTSDEKIYASYKGEKYQLKKRLYELYEMYKETFIYINQGCLANLAYIDHFDTSISGTLMVIFKSGYKDYASRRQIKNIKERIGIRK